MTYQSRNFKPRHQSEEAKSHECQVATLEDHGHDIETPKQPSNPTVEGIEKPKPDGYGISKEIPKPSTH
ncbi:hypothetical protein J1N35_016243 [Gossypium stocksii]|uniref:Uncharacterized protein n=1 Tax=Gossypium stocksii TaxID=47602 RepID=A0A9D3VJV4_9ROSI|nr:hypothetical protein J1N35_016243 [Gossypium stocksii]